MQRYNPFEDFRDLFQFIGSIWGGLAAVSISLAWVNSLFGLIPLHPTMPDIALAVALAAAAFAFLYAFVEGEENGIYGDDPTGFRRQMPNPRQATLRSAFGRFTWSVIALIAYFGLINLAGMFTTNGQGPTGPIGVALVPALLVAYAATFGFLTSAFSTLAAAHQIAIRRRRYPIASVSPITEARRPAFTAYEERTEAIRVHPVADGAADENALKPDLRIDQTQ